MYKNDVDSRIFMASVLDYDAKERGYAFAPEGKELVFQDTGELVRYLAFHTDTHGCCDPVRWSCDMISRQFSRGRAARTWTVKNTYVMNFHRFTYRYVCETTEHWDLWFHDAYGRTVDVRDFWPDVIAAVRRGDMADIEPPARRKVHLRGRARHTQRWGGREANVGAYVRALAEEDFYDDDGVLIGRWKPRGRLLENARLIGDFDWSYKGRSRHSTGWKDRKCGHQWEHRVREQEKHMKNREREALRR